MPVTQVTVTRSNGWKTVQNVDSTWTTCEGTQMHRQEIIAGPTAHRKPSLFRAFVGLQGTQRNYVNRQIVVSAAPAPCVVPREVVVTQPPCPQPVERVVERNVVLAAHAVPAPAACPPRQGPMTTTQVCVTAPAQAVCVAPQPVC
jgi:hypothetical protein